MPARHLIALAALSFAACLPTVRALAAEEMGGDPWAEGEDARFDPEGIPYPDEPGDEPPPFMTLVRCRMDALESARYSIAQVKLQRGDVKGAVAALLETLEGAKGDSLRDVTNFNLALLHERWLHDLEGTSRHYRAVNGLLRHTAQRRLLHNLARAGKPDEAAKAADEFIARAKEKGEKLALLHRLALTYKTHRMPDRAQGVYERILKEYLADDLRQMREAMEREVVTAVEKMRRLRQADRDDEVEQIQESLTERRPQELRAAGRWDELAAFEKARDAALRKLEQEGDRDQEGPAEPPKKADF